MQKLLFLALLSWNLFSTEFLHDNYHVESNSIKLSDVVKDADDTILYKMLEGKHTKRVKAKDLLQLLQKNGYKEYKTKHTYVKFIQKSPIDISKIKNFIKTSYLEKYPQMHIKNIDVKSRGYIESLPSDYTLKMQSKNYLRNSGVMYIKSFSNKEIFFNYHVEATLDIFIARKSIHKGEELSALNIKKKSIVFEKFNAKPLLKVQKATLQSKHNIKEGKLLTSRDIQTLFLIKRGSNVNVVLDNTNLSISFSAKAMQNGSYGDTITVMKSNGKRLKAKVVARHKAEVQ